MAKEKMKTKKQTTRYGLEKGLPTLVRETVREPVKSGQRGRAKPKVRKYYCRHCRAYHLVNSAVGRLHARASYWRKKAKAGRRK